MVGGRVEFVEPREDGGVDLVVTGTGYESNRTIVVGIHRGTRSDEIRPGDKVWWHARRLMWTPAAGMDTDVVFSRIGHTRSLPVRLLEFPAPKDACDACGAFGTFEIAETYRGPRCDRCERPVGGK